MRSAEEETPRRRDWEEVRCAIAVVSDTVSAAEVTSHVEIEPTSQRVKGEPRAETRTRKMVVASHRWVWQPDDSIELSLAAQIDAIWAALGMRANAFRSLPSDASVWLDIWIVHRGRDLSLGWVLDRRRVEAVAAFGASLNVDEYDDTGGAPHDPGEVRL